MSGDKEKQNEPASQADAPYNQPREQHLRLETVPCRLFAGPRRRRCFTFRARPDATQKQFAAIASVLSASKIASVESRNNPEQRSSKHLPSVSLAASRSMPRSAP